MNKPFDMDLFLTGVLKGSHSSRQRHLSQAKIIQKAISNRWKKDNPWRWKLKHIDWFYHCYLKDHKKATKIYYLITLRIIETRVNKILVRKIRTDKATTLRRGSSTRD